MPRQATAATGNSPSTRSSVWPDVGAWAQVFEGRDHGLEVVAVARVYVDAHIGALDLDLTGCHRWRASPRFRTLIDGIKLSAETLAGRGFVVGRRARVDAGAGGYTAATVHWVHRLCRRLRPRAGTRRGSGRNRRVACHARAAYTRGQCHRLALDPVVVFGPITWFRARAAEDLVRGPIKELVHALSPIISLVPVPSRDAPLDWRK